MIIDGLKKETFVSANTTIDKVKHVSNVTVDWGDITVDQLQALAQRSIIIRKQNEDRLAGVVPKTAYTIKAVDYVIGTRKQKAPVSIDSQIAELTPAELQILMEKINQKLGL